MIYVQSYKFLYCYLYMIKASCWSVNLVNVHKFHSQRCHFFNLWFFFQMPSNSLLSLLFCVFTGAVGINLFGICDLWLLLKYAIFCFVLGFNCYLLNVPYINSNILWLKITKVIVYIGIGKWYTVRQNSNIIICISLLQNITLIKGHQKDSVPHLFPCLMYLHPQGVLLSYIQHHYS